MSTMNGVTKGACSGCGDQLAISGEYRALFGDTPFCQDCVVHTACQSCSTGLRVKPARFEELGGDPIVCRACAEAAESEQSGSQSWAKRLFSVKTAALVVVALVALVALQMPATTGFEADAMEGAGQIGGAVLFLYLMVGRGKNSE